MLEFGKVVIEEGYRNGNITTRTRRTHESLPITSRKELIDRIFDELAKLKECDSVLFEVIADHHSHEPVRIVVTSEEKL